MIETSAEAQLKITALQDTLRKLLPLIYGDEPYTVEMALKFPESMPDYVSNGADGKLIFELAPLALAPYSTAYFLDVMADFKVNSCVYVYAIASLFIYLFVNLFIVVNCV